MDLELCVKLEHFEYRLYYAEFDMFACSACDLWMENTCSCSRTIPIGLYDIHGHVVDDADVCNFGIAYEKDGKPKKPSLCSFKGEKL